MASAKNESVLLLLKALGNPVRLRILDFLSEGEYCVCDIRKRLDLPQNLVSHHLSILRKNKLITPRKSGKWTHYSLNPANLCSLESLIEKYKVAKKLTYDSRC